MTFRVGMNVVCVNDAAFPLWAVRCCVLPVQGHVYTIRRIWDFSRGTVLYLNEITNDFCCINDDTGALIEPGFPARRFRPLVSRTTDISFTEGAPKDSEQFDNRRKVGVEV